MFKKNEGILDRIVRVTLGVVLLPSGLFWLDGLQGSVSGLVVAGLGGIGLLTGLTGFCLLYVPFGINTREKEKELIDRFRAMASEGMDRCMSMMAEFRQVSADRASLSSGEMCGPCPPSSERSHNQ